LNVFQKRSLREKWVDPIHQSQWETTVLFFFVPVYCCGMSGRMRTSLDRDVKIVKRLCVTDHQNKELPRKTRADAGSPSA